MTIRYDTYLLVEKNKVTVSPINYPLSDTSINLKFVELHGDRCLHYSGLFDFYKQKSTIRTHCSKKETYARTRAKSSKLKDFHRAFTVCLVCGSIVSLPKIQVSKRVMLLEKLPATLPHRLLNPDFTDTALDGERQLCCITSDILNQMTSVNASE